MMSSRMIAIIVAGVVLAAILGIVGFVVALDLASWKAELAGVTRLVFADAREPRGIQIATALFFAWPPLAAAIACGVHLWRTGEAPSTGRALLYLAIPLVILHGFAALVVAFFPVPPEPAMIQARTLAPTMRDAQLAGLVSFVMWLYIGVRGRNRERVRVP